MHGADPAVGTAFPCTELALGLVAVVEGDEDVGALVSWAVWAAFAVDFAIRLWLAGRYAKRRWYDVALVVLPFLRPIRLLRLLAFARVLNRTAAGSLVGQVST